MKKSTLVVTTCAAVAVAGCSVHPLPEQFARDTTADIVFKIHCEGREALDDLVVKYLGQSENIHTVNFAERVGAGTMFARELLHPQNRAKLDQDSLALLAQFTLSSVVFDFSFKINEIDDNTINANFRMPYASPTGTFTLGLKGGGKFARQATRTFQVGTTFFALHSEDFDPEKCDTQTASAGNLVYPITGKIGLEEVFDTFIRLSATYGGLGSEEAKQKKTAKFADKLLFTTTLSSSVTPKVTLAPIADLNNFRLADASGNFGHDRIDAHGVDIVLAQGPVADGKTLLQRLERGREAGLKRAFLNANLERSQNTLELITDNQDRIRALEQ